MIKCISVLIRKNLLALTLYCNIRTVINVLNSYWVTHVIILIILLMYLGKPSHEFFHKTWYENKATVLQCPLNILYTIYLFKTKYFHRYINYNFKRLFEFTCLKSFNHFCYQSQYRLDKCVNALVHVII